MKANREDKANANAKDNNTGYNPVIIILILIILLAAGSYYYFTQKEIPVEPETLAEPVVTLPKEPLETQAKVPETTPEIKKAVSPTPTPAEPIIPAPQPEPLPSLAKSDPFVYKKALAIANGMDIKPFLHDKNIIRQFVVFVDNLSNAQLARNASPLQGPAAAFSVSEISNKSYISAKSYHRYDLYADFMDGLDETLLAETYQQLQPLFNESLAELGYNNASFNDRMLKAIDLLLATPISDSPIEVQGVSVNYRFADPKLEALSGPQKLLIRMGPDNAKKVKASLARLKKVIAENNQQSK